MAMTDAAFENDMTELNRRRKAYESVPRGSRPYTRRYEQYLSFLKDCSQKYHMDYEDLAMTAETYQ